MNLPPRQWREHGLRMAYERELEEQRRRPKPPQIVRRLRSLKFRFGVAKAMLTDGLGIRIAVRMFLDSPLYSDFDW